MVSQLEDGDPERKSQPEGRVKSVDLRPGTCKHPDPGG